MRGTTDGRRRRARLGVALTIAAAALAAACGSGTESSSPSAPASAGGNGKAVYERSCATCHGNDLRGTELGPSHLSKVYEASHHGDASFRKAIAQGSKQHHWCFGDMPPVPGLSEQDVTDVIAYIRLQQQTQGIDEGDARC